MSWTLSSVGLARAPQTRTQAGVLGTASLSGRVVDQGDGTPLAAVRVLLLLTSPGGGTGPARETFTDPSGGYTFPKLPPGTYEIAASSPGWLTARYGQKKPERSGTPIVISDRETLGNLTIRMFRGGVIAGQVSGQNAQPLAGIAVQAFRMRYSASGRFLEPSGSSLTDDRGQYRIFSLSPGEYIVRASPVGVILSSVSDNIALDRIQPRTASGYVRTFFPGWLSAGQAAPLVVAAGEERGGVDFALPFVPFVSIRGHLVGPNGPVTNVQFTRVDDDGLLRDGDVLGSANGPDGRFVLPNIPSGALTLVVRARETGKAVTGSASAGTLWGTARIAVGGRDVSDVIIAMQPGATVSGSIKFEGKSTPTDLVGTILSITVQPAGATPLRGEIFAGRVDRDGRFSIGGVPPGSYHLTTVNLPAPWSITSVVHESRDLSSVPFDTSVGDTTGVVITLTDRPASLSGLLRAPDGVVVANYTVVAFPKDPASRAAHTRAVYAVRPNTGGRFTMPRVFPGEYLLAVTDDIESNSWFDPRILELLSLRATPVTVAPGEAKVQDLQIGSVR